MRLMKGQKSGLRMVGDKTGLLGTYLLVRLTLKRSPSESLEAMVCWHSRLRVLTLRGSVIDRANNSCFFAIGFPGVGSAGHGEARRMIWSLRKSKALQLVADTRKLSYVTVTSC